MTRLFHISDVHFGVEDRAALDAVARAIADERPDALVCTGDLTQRAKHSEYARAAEWFASLGVPVVLEPGNHDMPYYNPWERFTDPFRRYERLRAAVPGGQAESGASRRSATVVQEASNSRTRGITRLA